MTRAVGKCCGRPVTALAAQVTYSLHIAMKALEARSPQRRWYLTLQGRFRHIAGCATHNFGGIFLNWFGQARNRV